MEQKLFVGVDVSKGYADFEVVNAAGSWLPSWGRFDDTWSGHEQVSAKFQELAGRHPRAELVVGVECTGGYERNWLNRFRVLAQTGLKLVVYRLNPLAVKKFHERELHRTITDRLSAQGIAQYLWRGMRRQDLQWHEEGQEEWVTLCRTIRVLIQQRASQQTRLKALLSRAQPELVQYLRDGWRQWAAELLCRYPTATRLAAADPADIAAIPYLRKSRAQELVAAARCSVASQTGPGTALAVQAQAEQISQLGNRIGKLKRELVKQFETDEGVRIIDSIKGFGIWSAICLRLELGEIHRFPSAKQLVSFAGLDPRYHQSGDELVQKGISHRGRRGIRAILYPVAESAIQSNPAIRDFYARLRAKGKTHRQGVTACMRKLLHLVYACWIKGELFDPERSGSLAQKAREMSQKAAGLQVLPAAAARGSARAPVSRREAKKRKAAQPVPGFDGVTPQINKESGRPPSKRRVAVPAVENKILVLRQ